MRNVFGPADKTRLRFLLILLLATLGLWTGVRPETLHALIPQVKFNLKNPKAPTQISWSKEWRAIDLPFEFAQAFLSENNCRVSDKSLMACSQAINRILEYASQPLEFVPKGAVGNGQPIVDFGFARIQKSLPTEGKDFRMIFQANRVRLFHFAQMWDQMRRQKVAMPFETVSLWLKKNVIQRQNESEITAAAYNSYIGVMKDPHSQIVPMAIYTNYYSSHTKFYSGYGVEYRHLNDIIYVYDVREGSPAAKAGLRDYDIVAEANGHSTRQLSEEQFFGLLHQSDQLKLKIYRAGKELSIEMAKVKNQPFKDVIGREISRNNSAIGYLHITRFAKGICQSSRSQIQKFEQDGVKALVVDLRNNTGGDLMEALCLSNLFIKKGKVLLTVENLDGPDRNHTFVAQDNPETQLPMTVMINSRSASASEIFAGIIRDYARGIIIGIRSYGKGTTQIGKSWSKNENDPDFKKFVYLSTVGRYILPSGMSTQLYGIIPDVQVYATPHPSSYDKFALREEDQMTYLDPTPIKPVKRDLHTSLLLASCSPVQREVNREFKGGDYELQSAQSWAACISKPVAARDSLEYHR